MRARTAALAVTLLVQAAPFGWAQPVPDPAAELARARDLYVAAEAELADGRASEAVRDYTAVYEITKDPVLLWKLGKANEAAGACDVAIGWYQRYVQEAQPGEEYVVAAEQRIAACRGSSPSTTEAATSTGAATSTLPSTPTRESTSTSTSTTAAATETPVPVIDAPPPARMIQGRHRGPWLLVGGSIALLTIGGVLAYSANAAEDDLKDLYVSIDGNPPVFDAGTKTQYDDLVDQGHRYEHLSWVAFGLGGATALAAGTWYFFQRRGDATESAIHVAPTSNGISAFGRF